MYLCWEKWVTLQLYSSTFLKKIKIVKDTNLSSEKLVLQNKIEIVGDYKIRFKMLAGKFGCMRGECLSKSILSVQIV